MSKLILPTAYFPSIEYIQAIVQAETIEIEVHESFPKQTFRNRTRILSANGILPLTVPVCQYANHEITKNIKISYHENWQKKHWAAILSAYNRSPFFEFFKDYFVGFYEKKTPFLVDYNQEMLERILGILKILKPVSFAEDFQKNNMACFESKPYGYTQVFESKYGFTPSLSVLDLLSNKGNYAKECLY